jgi:DNA polymerase III epsilon subunit-like protein
MKTIYFDFETGGLNPEHPSIQLAAVAIHDETGEELATFECKIAFDEGMADPEALRLNHYSKELWANAVTPAVVAARFSKFIDPHRTIEMISKRTGSGYSVAKLAGYNALTFDLPRLRQLYGPQFFPCSYHVRDVLQRAMWWFDEHPEVTRPANLKLGTVCEFFGIATDGAHEALTDVRLTVALARKLASCSSVNEPATEMAMRQR